jgi:hypothetical protein
VQRELEECGGRGRERRSTGWREDQEGQLASAAACPPSHLASTAACPPSHLTSDAARLRRSSLPPPWLHLTSTAALGAPPLRRGLPMAQPQPPPDGAPGSSRRSTRGNKSEMDVRAGLCSAPAPPPPPRRTGGPARRGRDHGAAAEVNEGAATRGANRRGRRGARRPGCQRSPSRPPACRRPAGRRPRRAASSPSGSETKAADPAAGSCPEGQASGGSPRGVEDFRDGSLLLLLVLLDLLTRRCGCRDGGLLLCRTRVAGAGGGVEDREKEWRWWWDRGGRQRGG